MTGSADQCEAFESSVPPLLTLMGSLLARRREQLNQAVADINTHMTGDDAYQYRMKLTNPYFTGDESVEFEGVLPHYCIRVYRSDDSWRPVAGQELPGEFDTAMNLDYFGVYTIKKVKVEPYPPAEEAYLAFGAAIPTVMSLADDGQLDAEELIALPNALSEFYRQWKELFGVCEGEGLQTITTDIESIADHVTSRWKGDGADAYRTIIEDFEIAANAVLDGIQLAIANVSSISSATVQTCLAVLELAKKNADDVTGLYRDLIGQYPLQWTSIVDGILECVEENREAEMDSIRTSLNSIQEQIDAGVLIDQPFMELQGDLGGELRWPTPRLRSNPTDSYPDGVELPALGDEWVYEAP